MSAAALLAAGEALPVGARVLGRGFPSGTAPGVILSNGGGVVRVQQPGVGVVPWSTLDAGRELAVVDGGDQ